MASLASGSTKVSVTSHNNLTFKWWESEQSVTNNTSKISWELILSMDSYGTIRSTSSKSYSVTINSKTFSGTNTVGISSSYNNGVRTIASGSVVVHHANDGSYTFNYSFYQDFNISFSGSKVGRISGKGSGSLARIPRASTITVNNGTLGSKQTIKVNKSFSSYYHRIVAKVGSITQYIASSNSSATSYSWTPSLNFAKAETTKTTVSVTLTISTYTSSSATSSIGSYSKTITCNIPSSVKPTINSLVLSDYNGYKSKTVGQKYFIQNLSKIHWDAQATGSYGSTIKSLKLELNGNTYSINSSKWSYTMGGTWNTKGSYTAKLIATDSRGRVATKTTTITSIEYNKPIIHKFNGHRTNATIDDTEIVDDIVGKNVYVVYSASVYNNANYATPNTLTAKIYCKENGVVKKSGTFNHGSVTRVDDVKKLFDVNDDSHSYSIEMIVTDSFNQTVKKVTSVSTAFCLFHFASSGTSLGIGKICPSSGVNSYANDPDKKILDIGFDEVRATASAWKNLTIASGFKKYDNSDNNIPKIRRSGATIEIKGILEPTTTKLTSGESITIASGIPANMRPDSTRYFVCQGSGMNRWLLVVYPTGELGLQRYGSSSSYDSIKNASATGNANGTWLPFNATYLV